MFVCLAGGSGGRSEARYLGLRQAAHDSLGQKFSFFFFFHGGFTGAPSQGGSQPRNQRAQRCNVSLSSLWLVPSPPRRGGKSQVTLVAAHRVPAHWASFRRVHSCCRLRNNHISSATPEPLSSCLSSGNGSVSPTLSSRARPFACSYDNDGVNSPGEIFLAPRARVFTDNRMLFGALCLLLKQITPQITFFAAEHKHSGVTQWRCHANVHPQNSASKVSPSLLPTPPTPMLPPSPSLSLPLPLSRSLHRQFTAEPSDG